MSHCLMIIAFLFVVCVTTSVTALDCSVVTSFSPDVCLFDTSQQLNFIDQSPPATLCKATNINPFDNAAMTSTGAADRDRCNTAIRQDGSSCIQLYAKFQCSSVCTLCLKSPCKSFCDNIRSTCPGAATAGCFTQLPPCADSNTGCTNWNVDNSKLPGLIATTTTKAAGSTTTTTTTTHSTTTASSSSILSSQNSMIIASIILFLSLVILS